jgi:hypothetical protein
MNASSRGHRPDAGLDECGASSPATALFDPVSVRWSTPPADPGSARLQPCSPAWLPCAAVGLVAGGSAAPEAPATMKRPPRPSPAWALQESATRTSRWTTAQDRRALYAVRPVPVLLRRLSGHTVITLRTTAPRSFDLDFLLPVSRVICHGIRHVQPPGAPRAADHPGRRIPDGTLVRATVTYAGVQAVRLRGKRWFGLDGGSRRSTGHMAPWWFPSNDHPLDKARMDLHVRGARQQAGGLERPPPGVRRPVTARRITGATVDRWRRPPRVLRGRPVRGPPEPPTACLLLAVSRHLGRGSVPRCGASGDAEIVAWLQKQLGRYPFSRTRCRDGAQPGFSWRTRPARSTRGVTQVADGARAPGGSGDSVSVHHWSDVWLNEASRLHGAPLVSGARRPDHRQLVACTYHAGATPSGIWWSRTPAGPPSSGRCTSAGR